MIALMTSSQVPSQLAYQYLTTLFGPNTLTRLSVRKHLDLVKLLSSRIESSEISSYFKHMKSMFENPQVEEIYGKLMQFKENGQAEEVKGDDANLDSEDEDVGKKDEKQKAEIIRTYALNQIAGIPTMFRGKQLTPEILTDIIHFLVHLNYFSGQTDDIK